MEDDFDIVTERWPWASRTDSWGESSFSIRVDGERGPTISGVLDLLTSGCAIRGVVSDAGESIRLTDAAPTSEEVELAQRYLDDAGTARAVSCDTSHGLLELIEGRIQQWTVSFQRGAWAPDVTSLRQAMGSGWMRVANMICAEQSVGVGDSRHDVRVAQTGSGTPVLLGLSDSSAPPGVRTAIGQLASAHAWVWIGEVATDASSRVMVRLLPEDPIRRVVSPVTARGGSELFDWLHATEDANRSEAVRAEFRRIIDRETDTELPDGIRIVQVAERTRIALAADNIAAIEAAISAATRETRDTVEVIARRRFELRRDGVRNMLAVLLAVIGLAALLVRSPGLPPELIWTTAVVVSLVLVASGVADERVLQAEIKEAERLREALEDREHLPQSDRDRLEARLQTVTRRRHRPELGFAVWGSIAATVTVVLVAAATST